ncbi:MAG: thioredoxin domain-containing protein [Acidimicrobiia bacterium]
MKPPPLAVLALIAIGACSQGSVPAGEVPPLEPTTPSAVRELLASSDRPVVVNVWASWCIPCRSEAPLLRQAAAAHGGEIRFVGIDVRDTQDGARSFIAEFGLTALEHYFDQSGAVPGDLGGRGVPLTFFFRAGGDLVSVHHGVIDERTLALGIDELLLSGSG